MSTTPRAIMTLLAALLVVTATEEGLADEAPAPEEDAFAIEAGLNLRTDLGVHPLRLDLAARWPDWEVALVLDPMFWTDGQTSTDLLGWWLNEAQVWPLAGWRMTTVPLLDGAQFQQNLVLGVGLPLPRFFDGRLRARWGMELAMVVVKHGGGVASEWLSFASARHYLDLVNFAMFVRFDFHWGLL